MPKVHKEVRCPSCNVVLAKSLTIRQERLIAAMADPKTRTQTEAAKAAGMVRASAAENLAKPAIRSAIAKARAGRLDQATRLERTGLRLLQSAVDDIPTDASLEQRLNIGSGLTRLAIEYKKAGFDPSTKHSVDPSLIEHVQRRRAYRMIALALSNPDRARRLLVGLADAIARYDHDSLAIRSKPPSSLGVVESQSDGDTASSADAINDDPIEAEMIEDPTDPSPTR